jgi:dihydroneopterin aldolase
VSGGLDLLSIDDVEVPCVIGVYPEERGAPQPLVVSLRLSLDTRRAAHDEQLALTVDYARLLGAVRFVLQQGAFLLIETAAEVVAATVLASVDLTDSVTVTVKKPRALGGNGLPSLTITRHRDASQSLWTFPFGVVEVLHKTQTLGMYRLGVRARGAVRFAAAVRCFAIDDNRQGHDEGELRRVDNTTDASRSWLLSARPPLRLDGFSPG